MNIGIINNGLGNVGSVKSALSFYKYKVSLTEDINSLKNSDVLILAGVGHFKTAVDKLKNLNFWNTINEEVIDNKKPILGICLGMQLFADISYEDGETNGFGWIKGKVKKIEGEDLRIPHMGWNQVVSLESEIFHNIRFGFFYYMHSYHFIPENMNVVIASTRYGKNEIVAAVRKENIIGVQFHPEKSQGDGLRLFKNILEDFK